MCRLFFLLFFKRSKFFTDQSYSELTPADSRQSGHTNTGWTRLSLTLPNTFNRASLPSPSLPSLTHPELPSYYTPSSSSASSSSNSSSKSPSKTQSLPKITLRQTHSNTTSHLTGLKRTKGGISREGFDERQKSLKDFFSGGGGGGGSSTAVESTPVPEAPKEEEGVNGPKRGISMKSPQSPSPKKGRTE